MSAPRTTLPRCLSKAWVNDLNLDPRNRAAAGLGTNVIKHDGNVSASGRSTTRAPSGSFSVNRRIVDTAGTDTITFRAENTRSGEVCRGTVTL